MAANAARHGWPHCCTSSSFSFSASLNFHQQSLVLQSPGQPTALIHADPVWSILSPAFGVFSPAWYAFGVFSLIWYAIVSYEKN